MAPAELGPPLAATAPPIPPPLEPPPSPTAVPAEPDAGTLVELEIEVVVDGRRAPGHPVDLDCRGTRVHRPADVMGFARFELPPGECELHEGPLPVVLRLESAPVRPRLEVARPSELIVRVVDERGERVREAEVLIDGQRHLSDWNGVVSLRTWSSPVAVWRARRAASRRSGSWKPPAEVTLVLEEAGVLQFVVREPTGTAGFGWSAGRSPSASTRSSANQAGSWSCRPPSGAREDWQLSGSCGCLPECITTRSGHRTPTGVSSAPSPTSPWRRAKRTIGLKLTPLAPITGVVRNTGAPLPGVSLVLGVGMNVVATATSDAEGRFSLDVNGVPLGDPVLEVAVLEPWRVATRAFVRLGDAPIALEVVALAP
ncbi:MAG: hypothetical protein JNJ54_19390 [Myxococcaceae bacterium]|nr:hypothetical protein [Myxococcaceae bacterium]